MALTKTKKRGHERKDRLLSAIRESVSLFPLAFVFELQSPRNVKFKQLREEWTGSKFFHGKNRVMQVALGRTTEEEQREGIHKLAPVSSSAAGRHCQQAVRPLSLQRADASVLPARSVHHRPPWPSLHRHQQGGGARVSEESSRRSSRCPALPPFAVSPPLLLPSARRFFSSFSHPHYARSGCVAPRSFTLSAGPLPSDIAPHPLEPTLRKLGLPTRLQQSVVELLSDVVVCREGDVLTPEQCRLLQIFQQQMAVMRVRMVAVWEAATGEVEEVADDGGGDGGELGASGAQGGKQQAAASEMATEGAGAEEEEDEDDEGDEFIPEPYEGWGEVAVPTIAR